MKRAMDAAWADIRNRLDLNIIRGTATDQNVAFVSSADHPNTNWIAYFLVPEVHRTQPATRYGARTDDSLHEFAASETNRFVKIVSTCCSIFWAELIHFKFS
jgi:hypothetical protein